MSADAVARARVQIRCLRPPELPELVSFWNRAFRDRRNFVPLSETLFRSRILECPAFDPSGFILAWRRAEDDAEAGAEDSSENIVGVVHAFRPPPDTPVYNRWGRHHTIALLYVGPEVRRQGIGGRLLKAAEQWLYYCPVYFAGQSVPCYGGVEGPRSPLFGSTQRMGVNAKDSDLIHFLSRRRYEPVDAGEVSMSVDLRLRRRERPPAANLDGLGLRLINVDHANPYRGREADDRPEYLTWRDSVHEPYAGILLVDRGDMLRGHLCWYPLTTARSANATAAAGAAGIYAFWLEPALRGNGLGSLLLDTALTDMAESAAPGGPFQRAEVQTHLVRHQDAVALYESRGFQVDDAWVTLVKT